MEGRTEGGSRSPTRQVALLLLLSWFPASAPERVRFSLPEETEKGSVVGSLPRALQLDPADLAKRGLHILSLGKGPPFSVRAETGDLYVSDRIDREQLCGEAALCPIDFEVVAESPMNVFHVTVEVQDINDNAPQFLNSEVSLEISESSLPGTTFLLEEAEDPDVGENALQDYHLSQNQYFLLAVRKGGDGNKYAELVLNKHLDHETENNFHLILTALDGGKPTKTGTATIWVSVLDANDNSPIFAQDVYAVSLKENAPLGTLVTKVQATDRDGGSYGQITYGFSNIPSHIRRKFDLNSQDGSITVKDALDFEETERYQLAVEARDGGGLVAHCKVQIKILDENDNAPAIILASSSSPLPEDSDVGTLVALLNVNDRDSGENGQLTCHLRDPLPFKIVPASNHFYKLLTDGPLDRESTAEYNITITATDNGTPPLSTDTMVFVQISDVNDNTPTFAQPFYTAYVPENNPSGASIFRVHASDPDLGRNAHITYSLLGSPMEGVPLSSYLSINSESGTLHAQRAFDYEQCREFQVVVRAQDGGSTPLSSSATVAVFILDQNDRSPQILYPAQGTEGPASFEMVPRSAEEGYLVTKVVAVDEDSGHNAWLSYHLLQATDPSLFAVGPHNGEIRTARVFSDRDAVKHKLVILVKDNGQPALSATVSLNLVFAETFQEALPEINRQPSDPKNQSDLQFYLVLALALISFLFLLTVTLVIMLRLRQSGSPKFLQCFAPVPHSNNALIFPPNYEEGTLPYSYQLCLSSESRIHEFAFPKPPVPTTEIIPFTNKSDMLMMTNGDNAPNLEMGNGEVQAQPNTDWRFSQAQRPGTSGSQNGDENGTWPNNQFDTEMLQAMILASANEAAAAAAANPDGGSTLGGGAAAGTMGLSARYGPQFTLQHVPDYRQNVYIPGGTSTLSTSAGGKRDGKPVASGGGNKKKSGKKEKK